jgi:hypothetical protein
MQLVTTWWLGRRPVVPVLRTYPRRLDQSGIAPGSWPAGQWNLPTYTGMEIVVYKGGRTDYYSRFCTWDYF